MKSPLEVFNFPDPPKDPPKNNKVNHYKARKFKKSPGQKTREIK